jgi:hypothetical protein
MTSDRQYFHKDGPTTRTTASPLNAIKLRRRPRASTLPLRGYAQHERPFSARPERSVAKSKDERTSNLMPLHRHYVAVWEKLKGRVMAARGELGR